jgi:type VI secretion system secreted protein VgrG
MATFTQEKRLLAVSTPLGKDVFLLTGFSGREEMSRLFSYRLEMISAKESVAPADIVGKGVTWSVTHFDKDPRFFHGVVSRIVAAGRHVRGFRVYRAEVVPWLWLLTRTANCRIFQNKSVPEIIKAIFDGLGLTDYKFDLRNSYPKWEYCVQYRETAFNFVSRLMEQEGIFYFFRHEEGKHTLVLADQKSAYQDCHENSVKYTAGSLAPNHLTAWEHRYEFRPGKWAQTDYNFQTPSTNLLTSAGTLTNLPQAGGFEVFDYPGEYEVKADGDAYTKVRMEEDDAAYNTVTGAGRCCTFTPGGKFTVAEHDIDSEAGKEYVVLSVQHSANDPSTGPSGRAAEYSNSFTCIPSSVTFRAARLTPKPVVQGVQTAVVVGPKGEEIYTDKYARVKVQFFWDREGKRDENSSCWVRVSETWAGKNWGMICNPRIGQEVIVDFLEGDPDRPIITGRVYNAEQMPPFPLPAKQMVTGFKSNSTKGGGGYNEMTFDDTKGNELVNIHGQYDMATKVEHDERVNIGNNRTEQVGNNETITIGVDRKEKVGSNETIDIGANRTETVGKNESITVALTRTRMVGVNESVNVGAAQEITVGGLRAVTVGLTQAITVGGSQTITVGSSETESYASDHTQTVGGGQSVTVAKDGSYSIGGGRSTSVGKDDGLTVAKKLTIDAGEEIIIKTGDAMIAMKKDGSIEIKGKDILIQGSGKITEKADGDFVIKGGSVGIN